MSNHTLSSEREFAMKKLLLSSAVALALSAPGAVLAQAAAPAATSPHTFTGNVGLFSDYRFRGISQTFKEPAIQGGFDYSHASGFYAGTWASNVYGGSNGSGLGVNYANGNMEWDFYGGYKFEAMKDLTLDVGVLQYYYPGARYLTPTRDKYDNTEVYLGASYKWFTAKYSHSITDYFGIRNNTVSGACGVDGNGVALTTGCAPINAGGSKGSSYLDLGATFELGGGFNLVTHIGKATVRHYSLFNYTDWKIGVTKDWLGVTWGLAYIDTNAKPEVYRTAQTQGGGNLKTRDTSDSTILLSVSKTF